MGTGGVGKTRLAIEAATLLADQFPGGCWFVDLTAVGDPDLVARTMADVLSIDEQPGDSLLDSLTEALSHRSATLVVLDNCEHVLHACAVAADQILLGAPAATLLATSRQRLGIPGEHAFPVGPLAVDDHADDGGVASAVELFLERAREAAPGIELSSADLAPVAQLCARLDGIPLAIELAASQVRVLEPAEIAARLDDRLRFEASLTLAAARQRTLDAAVGWSYERLSERARSLFDRLAVFADSCTFEAAEALAPSGLAGADVLAALTDLIEPSF